MLVASLVDPLATVPASRKRPLNLTQPLSHSTTVAFAHAAALAFTASSREEEQGTSVTQRSTPAINQTQVALSDFCQTRGSSASQTQAQEFEVSQVEAEAQNLSQGKSLGISDSETVQSMGAAKVFSLSHSAKFLLPQSHAHDNAGECEEKSPEEIGDQLIHPPPHCSAFDTDRNHLLKLSALKEQQSCAVISGESEMMGAGTATGCCLNLSALARLRPAARAASGSIHSAASSQSAGTGTSRASRKMAQNANGNSPGQNGTKKNTGMADGVDGKNVRFSAETKTWDGPRAIYTDFDELLFCFLIKGKAIGDGDILKWTQHDALRIFTLGSLLGELIERLRDAQGGAPVPCLPQGGGRALRVEACYEPYLVTLLAVLLTALTQASRNADKIDAHDLAALRALQEKSSCDNRIEVDDEKVNVMVQA